jgi:hypothetical protein
VPAISTALFKSLYDQFQAPINPLNCGDKCAPYNEYGVPFCCDTRHAIPTAYQIEWTYLQNNTDLWHPWRADDPAENRRLEAETPPGQVRIECLGHTLCQRDYRSLTCRAFPFFPYLTSEGAFIGLSYYWEYEDQCWVLSNLQEVSRTYRAEFLAAYETLLVRYPEEQHNFQNYSAEMRRVFQKHRRAIPLLHRNGGTYKITPHNERTRRVPPESLSKFGPYKVAAILPFPDEIS